MDAPRSWEAAVAGRSGVRVIQNFDASAYPVRIAGELPEALELPELPHKEARRLDRVIKLALKAAAEASRSAGLEVGDAERERVGVSIGSGIGGVETLQEAHRVLFKHGHRRVSPFAIPMILSNMPAGYVAIRQRLQGPNLCHVAACASGAHALGEAARVIERGDADAMLAGGVEAPVAEVGIAGFAAMRALSQRNDEPQAASRPFDRDRDGFVMGEGAAVLVLESREQALERGAPVLAELLGYGMNADAAHIAAPTDNAEGAQRCMRLALADAGLSPADVDYLNAHATSTDLGDASEARAIRAVFGAHSPAVSSTKSMTGHLLGASGALEALFCVRALETGVLPPTINLDRPDPECELDHVAHKARHATLRVALSNSFGFGGTNASLVFGQADR
jgi:3-oxoacyl-[acyl-carrier-protein] synthase II